MTCPNCGKEMKEGYLAVELPILWTQTPDKLTRIKGKNDIYLMGSLLESIGRSYNTESIPAWICEDCRKVIFDY